MKNTKILLLILVLSSSLLNIEIFGMDMDLYDAMLKVDHIILNLANSKSPKDTLNNFSHEKLLKLKDAMISRPFEVYMFDNHLYPWYTTFLGSGFGEPKRCFIKYEIEFDSLNKKLHITNKENNKKFSISTPVYINNQYYKKHIDQTDNYCCFEYHEEASLLLLHKETGVILWDLNNPENPLLELNTKRHYILCNEPRFLTDGIYAIDLTSLFAIDELIKAKSNK